jgi:hypothetical protein
MARLRPDNLPLLEVMDIHMLIQAVMAVRFGFADSL